MTEKCKHNLPIGQCAFCLTDPDIKNKSKRDQNMENFDNRTMKECHGPCGKEKFLDEFPKNPGSKDGHENTCKAGRAKRAKDLYENRKEQEKVRRLNEEKKPETNPTEEEVTTQSEPPPQLNPEIRQNTTLYIEMFKHRDLMDRLIKAAEEDMRTPELQALYFIKEGLDGQFN